MTTLQQLTHYCNELLQPSLFNDFCTNGVQVEGKPTIAHLACAVSASLAVIRRAVDAGADCLLVHHGLFWQRDSHDIKGVMREKLRLLLQNDISLIAYHLPLDAHRTLGNNWQVAQQLGWTDLEPFPADERQPIGVKGRFAPLGRAAFARQLAAFYGNEIDSVLAGPELVQSAALVSGGAHKWIMQAAHEKLDSYITGTRDEPTWHQAHELGVNFYAVGHSASEVIGPQALGRHLAAHFDLAFTFLDEDNPF
jgi:dinuclear metal center YbgI/SA1388 family protein